MVKLMRQEGNVRTPDGIVPAGAREHAKVLPGNLPLVECHIARSKAAHSREVGSYGRRQGYS